METFYIQFLREIFTEKLQILLSYQKANHAWPCHLCHLEVEVFHNFSDHQESQGESSVDISDNFLK